MPKECVLRQRSEAKAVRSSGIVLRHNNASVGGRVSAFDGLSTVPKQLVCVHYKTTKAAQDLLAVLRTLCFYLKGLHIHLDTPKKQSSLSLCLSRCSGRDTSVRFFVLPLFRHSDADARGHEGTVEC